MATPAHNLVALTNATWEFSFSENATTAAAAQGVSYGYLDFGNIVQCEVTPEIETLEHFGSYRGIRRKDKTLSSSSTIVYAVTFDELNSKVLPILYSATDGTDHTQSSQSGASADALDFSVTASDSTKWYDITVSGARIRNLTTVTIATLTEGTDFEVDTQLGRIRFLVGQSVSRTPVITAPAITSSSDEFLEGIIPLQNITRSGFGRMIAYDQDENSSLVLDHADFSCELTVNGNVTVDGQSISEVVVNVEVTDTVGTLYYRGGNA